MKRKNRKIDTSHKRCKKLGEFLFMTRVQIGETVMDKGDKCTIEGVYQYGSYRKK